MENARNLAFGLTAITNEPMGIRVTTQKANIDMSPAVRTAHPIQDVL
jgi:hypothetical protein